MTRKQVNRSGLIDSVIMAVVAFLAIATVLMSYKLNRIATAAQNDLLEDLPAFSTRAEYDFVRILEHLNGFQLEVFNLEELTTKFDIFWSRLLHYVNAYNTQYSGSNDEVRLTVEQLLQELEVSGELLNGLSYSDTEQINVLRVRLNGMYGRLVNLTTLVRESRYRNLQKLETSQLHTTRIGTVLVFFTLLMGGVLLIRLWNDLKKKAKFGDALEKEVQLRIQELNLSNENYKKEAYERKLAEDSLAEREHQMQSVQKMESIGRITVGVAHDFNNLLTVIMGNIELLLDSKKQDRTQRLLNNTMMATNRGSQLTRKLLAFGRRSILQPESVDVNKIVAELNDMFLQSVSEAISLSISLEPKIQKIRVDRSLFENVLLNLVINARDAMPFGGKLKITTRDSIIDTNFISSRGLQLEAGAYISIAVTDTGEGMTDLVLEQAFEPFFTTKSEALGSGLGLSMAYGFVCQSNGTIQIDSHLGLGTSVTLFFPVDNQREFESQIANGTIYENDETPRTILVNEDSNDVRQVVVEQLQALGYETIEAENGDVAMDILRKNDSIDLLLTDVVMRGVLQGQQLVREARRIQPNLKVVYMSGYPKGAYLDFDSEDNQSTWLIKPISLALLSQTLLETFKD